MADSTPSQGKYTAMIVSWLLGFGSILSWNCMVTLGDYYYALFPENYHPSRVLTLIYQVIGFGTLSMLLYNEAKVNTRKRVLTGYTIYFLSTLALIILDICTSGKGQLGSFVCICVLVALFGIANAQTQGGMIGNLSLMCPEFLQSFLAGNAASGALTSCMRLITKAAFDKSANGLRKGALLFLGICTFFELLCIFIYAFIFPRLAIVKHYHAKAALEGSKTVSADLFAAGIQMGENEQDGNTERLSIKQLLLQNIDYALDVYLTYALTLSIFPGFLFENTGTHRLGSWYAIVLIAVFNGWDFLASYIPLIECIKLQSRKSLMIATICRFLFIPAFYFTSKYGDQGWMLFLSSFLGLTNGYLTICVLTDSPRGYKGPEKNALGNLLQMSTLAGISSGAALGWLWIIGNGKF